MRTRKAVCLSNEIATDSGKTGEEGTEDTIDPTQDRRESVVSAGNGRTINDEIVRPCPQHSTGRSLESFWKGSLEPT